MAPFLRFQVQSAIPLKAELKVLRMFDDSKLNLYG